MIRRWLPFPLLSAFIFGMWLLLNQSLSSGHLILGAGLAIGGALFVTALAVPRIRLRRPLALAKLLAVVLRDIIRSNIAVARIILGPRLPNEISGFVDVPLELRAPYGLALLAIIITATPGTLWVSFDSRRGILTIHVLDLVDENAWIRLIKHRYERLLREAFE